ncbi:MAG: undecaprenyldiphospho-muramoylpentapeptide beta-N-acetylglucosaminyltransferase [Actinomycetota bacterium]
MNVVVAGGGTAGHVNPALALAAELADADVTFIGTATGVEARLVPSAGYRLEFLDVRGFDRSRPLAAVGTGLRAVGATATALRMIRRRAPDAVVGMGGYVSLPTCLAARAAGCPVVLHEQNIVLGLANRVCKPVARRIATSFEDTLAKVGHKGVFTGNPVLPDLVAADFGTLRDEAIREFDLDSSRRTVLVFGGSQGARTVNDAAAGLPSVWADRSDVQVLHITGHSDHARVIERLGSMRRGALVHRVVEYAHDMIAAYAAADVALCRGGATTVAELGVAGLPAVVVPYPHHRDRQQELHGRVLEKAGAAIVIADSDASTDRVARALDGIVADDEVLARMSEAALSIGRPDAAARLANVVREVAT